MYEIIDMMKRNEKKIVVYISSSFFEIGMTLDNYNLYEDENGVELHCSNGTIFTLNSDCKVTESDDEFTIEQDGVSMCISKL